MRTCIRFLLTLLFTLAVLNAYAERSENIKLTSIYFKFDNAQVDPSYGLNHKALNQLRSYLQDTLIDRNLPVRIIAYASPEGNRAYNIALAERRLNNLNHFLKATFPEFTQLDIQLINGQLNWGGLKEELLSASQENKLNQKVLNILIQNTSDQMIDESLQQQLSQTEYRTLVRNYFPSLRVGEVELPVHSNLGFYETPLNLNAYSDSLLYVSAFNADAVSVSDVYIPLKRRIQPFALKTNMLFDLASALNVELEVPLAKRWSIAGEWMFPWWLSDSRQHCLEILSGTLEGKFWFPSKKSISPYNDLTGWYAGLYAGGGLYDIEWDKVGYQGEFYLAAGISAGYAHKISRTLSLEYGIGIGFLRTNYRKYKAQTDENGDWHLYKQKT
ncbi:MAG: DUF3575 domain-containing protein, partial [Bacteroidales bacterium]